MIVLNEPFKVDGVEYVYREHTTFDNGVRKKFTYLNKIVESAGLFLAYEVLLGPKERRAVENKRRGFKLI